MNAPTLTTFLIPCPYVGGPEPLRIENLHHLTQEEAGRQLQRLAADRQPGVVVGAPGYYAFYAVRAKLENAAQATEETLRAIFRELWPLASSDFRTALEIGYSYALQAIGVGASAQVVRAAVNELAGE